MSIDEHLDPIPDSFILQPPVFHPVIPYGTTIFGGLYAGKMVMLQGVVPLHAQRFQVDFQCGCCLHPRPDIAFHFNPRFYTVKPHVICNTLQGGLWQKEVRWPGVALQRGAGFLVLFLFDNEEVKVSVNGQHFLHYRYRLPLSRVDTLAISGDILVKAVGFLNINPFVEGSQEYPVGYEVPCSRALPRGLWPGQVIVVRGLVLKEPKEQNTGLGLLLGTKEADLSPLPLPPPAILRGAASVPRGKAEAGTQWAGAGDHQPGPEIPGAASGAQDQWKCPSLLCPLLRKAPRTPQPEKRKGGCNQGPTVIAPLCCSHRRNYPGITVSGLVHICVTSLNLKGHTHTHLLHFNLSILKIRAKVNFSLHPSSTCKFYLGLHSKYSMGTWAETLSRPSH
ncbi:galectin-12 isoform X3 [Arvicanthis niloticus]|uniref:galectin-12 isoform X3 n=1 Tax=Arvicanthis niloticus TaxID=61156 RepID=UPI00402B0FA4